MATILHNQPIIRITDWLAAVCASLSVAQDLIYALNKIKTDKVDMDQFVSQLFRFKRHALHPSHGGSTLSRFFVLHRNYRKTL